MSPRFYKTLSTWALGSLLLAGCDVGQAIKTLGAKAVGGTGTPTTDAEAFSVTLAYRDPSSDAGTPNRTVNIQGVRALPSASFVNSCGATGSTCTCSFYRNTSDLSPAAGVNVGISSQNNSLSCVIPAAISDATIRASTVQTSRLYVMIRRSDDATKNSGLLSIATTLTLNDVLGANLSKTLVRGIYRYSCNRTFFEGEGVSPSQVTCTSGQHLGVISASYNFYTYRSGVDSNTGGGDSSFPGAICNRNDFLKIQCSGSTPDLRYGFYKDSAEPFVVGIQMTSAPEGTNLQSNYGFAALPDSAGNCPIGLVKVRPWVAQPASIIQNSLGNGNPPSSFINTNNSLGNTVVEQTQPANFVVNRQPNLNPCSSAAANPGDCSQATFNGSGQAESVAYIGLTPVVCAIPPALLSGLF